MTNQDAAFILDLFQSTENKGRGMECVRSIVAYLYRNDYSSAEAVRTLEGDKTRSHPLVEKLLYEIFGCRLHCKHNCDSWICEKVDRFVKE